jgi:hypothetical protein
MASSVGKCSLVCTEMILDRRHFDQNSEIARGQFDKYFGLSMIEALLLDSWMLLSGAHTGYRDQGNCEEEDRSRGEFQVSEMQVLK